MAGVRPCHACAQINMRPKFALSILVGSCFVFTLLLSLRPPAKTASASSQAGQADDPSLGGVLTGSGASQRPAVPPRLPAPAAHRLYAAKQPADGADAASAIDTLTPEQQEDAVNQRIIELSELGMRGDSASIGVLLSELNNSNPEIRRAALDAIMQSGNRESIPALQQLADRLTDPQQQLEIAQAIEFLTLPSISEVLAARGSFNPRSSVHKPSPAAFGRQ